MTLNSIQKWHELSRPERTDSDFQVTLGCHFEEIVEQLEALDIKNNPAYKALVTDPHTPAAAVFSVAINAMHTLAECLKSGLLTASIENREAFADAIGDQIVTGMGVAHCAAMNGSVIVERIDHSNWSKFVDGKPVFNEQGKIAKPATYQPPDLTGTY